MSSINPAATLGPVAEGLAPISFNPVLTTSRYIENIMEKSYQATQEDLKSNDLKHYDKLASACHHWSSNIPKAIEFFYDY